MMHSLRSRTMITLSLIAVFLLGILASCSKNADQKNTVEQSPSASETARVNAAVPNLQIVDLARYIFSGAVGEKMIHAEMHFEGAHIHGSYRYANGSRSLSLKGSLHSGDNVVQLIERDDMWRGGWEKDTNSTVSGRISGALDKEKGVLTGTWTSKDGKKTYPIRFFAIAVIKELKHTSLDVSVDYPVFTLPELSRLNDTLAQMADKSYRSSLASLGTMRQEYLKDENMKDIAERLYEYSQSTIVMANAEWLSVLWANSSYSGGAHGNYGYETLTWHIVNGEPKRMELHDFFLPGTPFSSLLSDILLKELRKQGASLVVEGGINSLVEDFEKGNIPYSIHISGLTFYFNPYHVASYAEGSFEVFVPWKSLQSILRKDSSLSTLFAL